jgi:hypothetical protein
MEKSPSPGGGITAVTLHITDCGLWRYVGWYLNYPTIQIYCRLPLNILFLPSLTYSCQILTDSGTPCFLYWQKANSRHECQHSFNKGFSIENREHVFMLIGQFQKMPICPYTETHAIEHINCRTHLPVAFEGFTRELR